MNTDSISRLGGRRRRPILQALLLSMAVSVILSFALMAAATAIAYQSEDPTALAAPLGVVALGLASLICGIASARLRGGQGLVIGLLSGLTMALIVALGSLALSGVESANVDRAYLLYAAIPMFSTFGGIIGNPRQKADRRRRR